MLLTNAVDIRTEQISVLKSLMHFADKNRRLCGVFIDIRKYNADQALLCENEFKNIRK